MKNSNETVKVSVRPEYAINTYGMGNKELELCKQNVAFHKAYLMLALEYEQAKYDELQARIAELQTPPVVTGKSVITL